MKNAIAKIPWVYRSLMIILIATGAIMLLIAQPFRKTPAPEESSGNNSFYSNLSYWSRESSLAADELEPDRYSVEVPDIEPKNVTLAVEAEDVSNGLNGAKLLTDRENFRGSGYIGGLPANKETAFSFPVSIPATQHYDITICMAADKKVNNALRIGSELLTNFSLDADKGFTRVTFYGIFLEKGDTTIALDTIDGGIDLDYLELTNNTSLSAINFDIDDAPCNPNATNETKKLYSVLKSQWGKKILTGQFASTSANRELALIHEMTGQYPAIRFGELGTDNDLAQIEAATDWFLYTGGIVGLMWQWNAPDTSSEFQKDVSFSLKTALNGIDIEKTALLDYDQIADSADNQTISSNFCLLIQDIDNIAAQLKKLANMNIPVLWRPLHEASGGWYWWGADGAEAYQQLWSLLYHRLTDYHHLNNLIWIWNGQSTSYLVPADTYDIASVDVYLSTDMTYGSRYEQFLSLAKITNGRKMLALSECSSLPSMEMMLLDNSIWSYFGLWYGDYIMDSSGKFSDTYYTNNDLYNLYNSDHALSLNDFLALCQ